MRKTVATLFSQEMTRREFLGKIGFLFLTLTGINALIKTLSPSANQKGQTGFGSGPYGEY